MASEFELPFKGQLRAWTKREKNASGKAVISELLAFIVRGMTETQVEIETQSGDRTMVSANRLLKESRICRSHDLRSEFFTSALRPEKNP